ncbi:uncharacterized protein METZ01_LOCUS157275 [marine metagenome]|uniref:Uncharacterized protein n=1 Tax=marine metagenome TaxID=408172 RepID=A0A382ASZ9_9ZZZZ
MPVTKHMISVKDIQNGAISSRDWAPLHSDQDWAINKGNLPNIIMNNYTLNGWIIKYMTDIFGPSTRVGKVGFKIKKPICPNNLLEFHGQQINENIISNNLSLMQLKIEIKVNEEIVASADATIGINKSNNHDYSPWKINSDKWMSYLQS